MSGHTVLGEMYDPNRAYSAGDVATFPSGNMLYATRNLAPGDQSSGAWASSPALTNIIGQRKMSGLYLLGADASSAASAAAGGYGNLFGGVLQATGELGQEGLNLYEGKQASEKASADDQSKLQAAISADATASLAMAAALSSTSLANSAPANQKAAAQAKAAADQAAADQAAAAQDRAGAAMPSSMTDKRVAAAQAALTAATSKLQSSPTNTYNQALVKAWTATVNKAQNNQIVKKDVASEGGEKGSKWSTKKKLVVAGAAVGGAGLLGGVVMLIRKMVRR